MPKVKVSWLCSRSQPGIKVIIRDLRGHLLHTVTFLVFFSGFGFFVTIHLLESSKLILFLGNVDCNKNYILCT